jgi:hypothetical protein
MSQDEEGLACRKLKSGTRQETAALRDFNSGCIRFLARPPRQAKNNGCGGREALLLSGCRGAGHYTYGGGQLSFVSEVFVVTTWQVLSMQYSVTPSWKIVHRLKFHPDWIPGVPVEVSL